MAGKPHIVVLTGAGISAESGLRTFRDSDGLWEGYDIHEVATPEAWARDPELVLRFYNERRRDVRAAQPNAAHLALVELESVAQVSIITQNIDDLHERAGSSNVLHLHGEVLVARSSADPELRYPLGPGEDIQLGQECELGTQLRPHVVWFGESVPMMAEAARLSAQADYFLVVGTSLVVYPAASLVDIIPDHCEGFVIDRRLPEARGIAGFTAIEAPASEALPPLVQHLLDELKA